VNPPFSPGNAGASWRKPTIGGPSWIHAVAATAANAHDSQLLGDLLHGEETRVWGDSAYVGQREVIRGCAPKASVWNPR
jgi:IS5 family transposase